MSLRAAAFRYASCHIFHDVRHAASMLSIDASAAPLLSRRHAYFSADDDRAVSYGARAFDAAAAMFCHAMPAQDITLCYAPRRCRCLMITPFRHTPACWLHTDMINSHEDNIHNCCFRRHA